MTVSRKNAAGLMVLSAFIAAPAAADGVTWWSESANLDQQAAFVDNMIDAFNNADNGHTITIDYRGYELDRQLRIAFLSGTGPDVVNTPGPAFVATVRAPGG